MTIALLTAMPSEMKPFKRRLPDGVVTGITGIGTTRATKAALALVKEHSPSHVIMVGVAGGLKGTTIGQVLVPATVIDRASGREVHPTPIGNHTASGTLATGDFTIDAQVVAELEAAGVNAVDMETASVGIVCEDHGIPWSTFRAISDRLQDGLVDDAVFKMAKPDGSPDLAAVARYVLPRPWKLPGLLKLGRDLNTATRAAADAALAAINAH